MDFDSIKQQEEEYLMGTYSRFPVVLVSGFGSYATDCDGKRYLDFTSGIGVNALGFCDPVWSANIACQLGTLQHCSNLYYQPVQIELAQKLCQLTGYSKVFFGNSGAEANECAIKLARKYGTQTRGPACNHIVTLQNSFHGRTVTTLAATGQEMFHQHFTPFTPGFSYAKPDMESVRAAVTENTCAVFVEFIQGEGGVLPLSKEFVTDLAAFCRERGVLLLADEVQTGVGRTGTLYCFEQYGVRPDAITSAKGLGGGLPIGACLCTEDLSGVLDGGAHGSTFGGNPAACAGAKVVLDRVADPEFLQEVREKGEYLRARLQSMPGISTVRGMGLMVGALPEQDSAKEIAADCVQRGLLLLTAKDMLRFLPPLSVGRVELQDGLDILEEVLRSRRAG